MSDIDELIIDIQAEFNRDGFGNDRMEDDSYQYIVTIIEEKSGLDETIKNKLLELLNESVPLQVAYCNMLIYLFELE